jgi:type I restriction enzyme S subunit
VATPTDIAEQTAIANFIDAESRELTDAVNSVRHEIALVEEFRARLIADVVTGKLDVRAAAAALPEITEIEPVDEPIDGENLEEAIDNAEAVAA